MYVSLGLIICAAVIILLWFVTMFFMRLFRLKWRESARKVIRRNGKERVLRQTLSSFISESGDGMRTQLDTLESALKELESGNCPDLERRRLLSKARSAISSVRKSVDNLSYFHLIGNNFSGAELIHNYSVERAVSDFVSEVRENPEFPEIDIIVSVMRPGIRVPLNPDIIGIMLMNILRNLTADAPEGRRKVKIRIGHTDRHGVSCNVRLREDDYCGKYLMLSVSIDRTDIPDTGRGLFFTMRLAELHRGYVWTSRAGEEDGTRITMAFPYEDWNYPASDFRDTDASGQDESPEEDRKEMTEEDMRLMDDLREIIRENVSNPELDVPFICEKMHISKSKLYYKVKTISGISPIEFLRQYRLEMASQLLSEKQLNVSEVADAVGFSSVSYFSKAYKKRYGILPSEKR